MLTLLVGMQSSGASYVVYRLAQDFDGIVLVDLFCNVELTRIEGLLDELKKHDALLKITINSNWERYVDFFKPDKLILVTRNLDDISKSLDKKSWRDIPDPKEKKIEIYKDILFYKLHLFDYIISYERMVMSNEPPIKKTMADIVKQTFYLSQRLRRGFGKWWYIGAFRQICSKDVKTQ